MVRHGYTNDTSTDGETVFKRYRGPDAGARRDRERRVLADLHGIVPVPPVVAADDGTLALGFVPGVHGQELIDTGFADEVLGACGTVLRQIHTIELPPGAPRGAVLVHGDFGPNNVLIDPATFEVTAVLDWEFAAVGDAVVDVAWCEWIVRTHHPDQVGSIEAFHAAYGLPVPPWPERREAMVARCVELQAFCERWQPGGDAVLLWAERAAVTAEWTG